ncbi:MAG: hypothetical protein KBA97_05525 [Methanothrix sp.]|nr:hypothetical protein [Methanothrix sp.]
MKLITVGLQSDEAINLYHPAVCRADLNKRCSNRQDTARPSLALPTSRAWGHCSPFVLPLACLEVDRF